VPSPTKNYRIDISQVYSEKTTRLNQTGLQDAALVQFRGDVLEKDSQMLDIEFAPMLWVLLLSLWSRPIMGECSFLV
jgi:hypothetical protein